MNELSDLFLGCKTCHEYFVFDVSQQMFFAERGLHQPKRCKNCRPRSNSRDSNENEQTTVNCASCGVETTVPFKPIQGKAVFCKPCYTRGRK